MKTLYSLLFLIIFSTILTAQDYEDYFNEGMILYNRAQFFDAINEFDKCISENEDDDNDLITLARIFKAKCEINNNRFLQAEEQLSSLYKCKSSKYRDEIKLDYSNVLIKNKKNEEALNVLVSLLISTLDETSLNIAAYSIIKLSENYSDKIVIHDLLEKKFQSYSQNPEVLLIKAKIFLKLKLYENAKQVLDDLLKNHSMSKPSIEAYEISKKVFSVDSTKNYILAIIDNSYTDIRKNIVVEDILEGMKKSLNDYNEQTNNKTGLLIRYVKDDSSISKVKEEAKFFKGITSIVGGFFTNDAELIIKEFADLNLPIYSPTATGENLKSNYDKFYQLNTPVSIRGKIMARYIFNNLNLKNIGIVSPVLGFASTYAKSFEEEFSRLGGNIIAKQVYRSNSTLYKERFYTFTDNKNNIEAVYAPLNDDADAIAVSNLFKELEYIVPIISNQEIIQAIDYNYWETNQKLILSSDNFVEYGALRDDIVKKSNFQDNFFFGYDLMNYLLKVEKEPVHNDIILNKQNINTSINIIEVKNKQIKFIERKSIK